MLSPWLEEMSNDLLRVVHGHALPRDVANDHANDDDGGRIAGEDASPAWLSAARRELVFLLKAVRNLSEAGDY